jgi:hypothetical protein
MEIMDRDDTEAAPLQAGDGGVRKTAGSTLALDPSGITFFFWSSEPNTFSHFFLAAD